MFFLGGLNSILPHLIYLSVIWAFLLIGFSGRIKLKVSDSTPDNRVQVSQVAFNDLFSDYTNNLLVSDEVTQPPIEVNLPAANYHFSCYSISLLQSPEILSDYRGPPCHM